MSGLSARGHNNVAAVGVGPEDEAMAEFSWLTGKGEPETLLGPALSVACKCAALVEGVFDCGDGVVGSGVDVKNCGFVGMVSPIHSLHFGRRPWPLLSTFVNTRRVSKQT